MASVVGISIKTLNFDLRFHSIMRRLEKPSQFLRFLLTREHRPRGHGDEPLKLNIFFTAWREDKNRLKKIIIGHGDVFSYLIFSWIYRLLHRKCAVRIFIHELQNFGKRTSERSERVSLPKFCNE